MLHHLLDMSADGSPEGRRHLLDSITDLFLLERSPSEVARDHYAHIANHSLTRMAVDDRVKYAERVAAEPTLPISVARNLASDEEIAVARLVLKLSPVLTDDDLASIALTHSQEHLIAIAERAAISEITTEVLVQRGSDTVLRMLSSNRGAQFSPAGFSRMQERGESDPEIARNLAQRSDKPPERQAQRVLRIAIAAEQSTGEGTKHARQRQQEVRSLLADVDSGRRVRDDVIRLVAEEDRAFDLALVLGAFADLPTAQVLKVLLEPDASGIAVAARAIGVPADIFQAILDLRARRLKQSAHQIARDLEDYNALPETVSGQTIRFLRGRSAAQQ
jgi:Uncharacterised protein conserved in bacteria (DUF2336)